MFSTIKNAWKVPELRSRMIFTLVCLFIFRLGSAVPVPFIDPEMLKTLSETFEGTIFGFMNVMSGGAFEQAKIFALSIQPYINASIIIQLLSVAIPALERLSKEGGEEGKKKIASITRYATIVIALLQGFAYYTLLRNGAGAGQSFINAGGLNSTLVAVIIIATFVAGSAFIMWLGEQITEHGIGNGISLILFVSIISRVFPALFLLKENYAQLHWYGILAILVVFLAVIAFIIFFDGAERRLSIQYAKRVVGRKMYGGRSTHLPIKVNMSGVMPIIFASSIATFPATIGAFFPTKTPFWTFMFENVFAPNSWPYAVVYLILIVAFSYFYTAIQFNPVEIANNLKNNGGFLPGFRPGKPTADFIAKVVGKVTLFGAFFLGVVAVLPILVGHFTPASINLSIGGTSVLIVVGVALETVKQLESQMMMRNYKGFLE